MGSAPMLKLLVSMSLPAMFSMFIQALYNIVDGLYVAHLNEGAFLAVSFALPVQMILISCAVGTGVGLNSLISRRLGEGEQEKANLAGANGLFIALLESLLFAVIGIIFANPFMSLFAKDPMIKTYGVQYLVIVMVFSFGMFMEIGIEKTLQATGNMFQPMLFHIVGAVINIILDPIFIFGYFGFPRLEVAGAAIATVVSQIVCFAIGSYVFFHQKNAVTISFKGFKPDKKSIKDIYAVGLPAMIMQSITAILLVGMNAILGFYSQTAVFVVGIYAKLENFIFMPVFGLTQGALPIMGYNYGAKNKERLVSCVKTATIIALILLLIGMAIFMAFPLQLLTMFDANQEAIEMGIPALRLISISFPFAAIGIVNSTFFQAIGKGTVSLIVSVMRQLVVILPALWALVTFFGIGASWYAFPFAEVFATIVSTAWVISLFKRELDPYFERTADKFEIDNKF